MPVCYSVRPQSTPSAAKRKTREARAYVRDAATASELFHLQVTSTPTTLAQKSGNQTEFIASLLFLRNDDGARAGQRQSLKLQQTYNAFVSSRFSVAA
jgi:hypothetical protein